MIEPRFTIIESPFAAPTPQEQERNTKYVRAAMRDCFLRGEIPLASHALYTLPGVLDDEDPVERLKGMAAGFALTRTLSGWARAMEMTWAVTGESWAGRVVVAAYTDFGISLGMRAGMDQAEVLGLVVEHRKLPMEVLREILP